MKKHKMKTNFQFELNSFLLKTKLVNEMDQNKKQQGLKTVEQNY